MHKIISPVACYFLFQHISAIPLPDLKTRQSGHRFQYPVTLVQFISSVTLTSGIYALRIQTIARDGIGTHTCVHCSPLKPTIPNRRHYTLPHFC